MSDNNSPQNNRQTNKAVIVIAIGGFFALTGLRAWDQHYVMFFLGLFIAVYGLFMLESNESKSQNNNQDEIHNGANNTSEFNTTTGYDNDEKIEITVNIDNDVHANKSTGPLQKEGVIIVPKKEIKKKKESLLKKAFKVGSDGYRYARYMDLDVDDGGDYGGGDGGGDD